MEEKKEIPQSGPDIVDTKNLVNQPVPEVKVVPSKEVSKPAGKPEAKKVEKKPTKPKSVFKIPNLYFRLAIFFVFSVLLIGGIIFARMKLTALAKQIGQKRGQYLALSEKDTSVKQLTLDFGTLEKEIALVEKALPDEEGMIQFLADLNRLKLESGVEITTFKFSNEQPKSDKSNNSYIELLLQATGPAENLELFFTNFFKMPVLLKTKMIDLNSNDPAANVAVLRVWIFVNPNFTANEKK